MIIQRSKLIKTDQNWYQNWSKKKEHSQLSEAVFPAGSSSSATEACAKKLSIWSHGAGILGDCKAAKHSNWEPVFFCNIINKSYSLWLNKHTYIHTYIHTLITHYIFKSNSHWLYLELNEMVHGLKKPWCTGKRNTDAKRTEPCSYFDLQHGTLCLSQLLSWRSWSVSWILDLDYQIVESFVHRSQCKEHWKKQWKPKTVEAAKTAARCGAKGAWGQCKNFC